MRKLINFLVFIVAIFFLITNVGCIKKVDYDNLQAEEILKEVYKPLEDFNKSLIEGENPKMLLVPENINNEEDFISLFNNKVSDLVAKDFYEALIINENKKLYVDSLAYIPSIYTQEGKVTKAYIKKRKYIFPYHSRKPDETLIIKESWVISGEVHKRTNEFIKDEKGKWVLHSFSGTQSYGFTVASDNPWYSNRKLQLCVSKMNF